MTFLLNFEKKYQTLARDYLKFLPKSPAKKIGLHKFMHKRRLKELSALITDHDIRTTINFYSEHSNDAVMLGSTKINTQDAYTLAFLFQCIKQTESLEGDIIELGSYKCGTSIMMAKFLKQINSKKKIFACDTYDGMPDDDEYVKNKIAKGMFSDTSFDFVSEQVKKFKMHNEIELVKGKFQDVFDGKFSNSKFSLVFMDCDIYSSAKFTIEFTYPRLVNDGIMLFHDYAVGKKPSNKKGGHIVDSEWGETKAVDDFLKDKIESLVVDSVPYIQKGRKKPIEIDNIPKNEFSSYRKS